MNRGGVTSGMTPTRATRVVRPAFSGLGLVGVLVVMLIITMLYFTAGPGGKTYVETVRDTQRQGQALAASIDEQQFVTLVVQHKLSTGEYPADPETLGVSTMPGYRDTRGVFFRFETRAEGNTTWLDFVSAGEDGEHGTEDDEVTRSVRIPI